ncbi:unnamed protein product [Nesidiocoris tenuis]|uniref:Non-structural maintenance of chromosomes element 4 n=1 Tax=Nesidiocoris tenuis TaxID=355587 RepID=A0A6H5H4T0_9HEMI|nr:unnamed protein product [Nesidiocoris tenuis]
MSESSDESMEEQVEEPILSDTLKKRVLNEVKESMKPAALTNDNKLAEQLKRVVASVNNLGRSSSTLGDLNFTVNVLNYAVDCATTHLENSGPARELFQNPPTREKKPRRQRAALVRGPATAPKKITTVEETQAQKVNMQTAYEVIRQRCRNGPIPFYRFVINPKSFVQTCYNIFIVSFLVHEQHAYLSIGDGHELLIGPKLSGSDDGSIEKIQVVQSLSALEWDQLVTKLNITESMLPDFCPKQSQYFQDGQIAHELATGRHTRIDGRHDDMERRRVAEIKKRFEDGESNPFTIVDNINNLNNNTSSEIRRRQLLRNSSQPEFRKTANGRSPNGQSARTEEQIDNHVGEKPVIKRTPAFRSSRNEFASVAKAIIGKNQPKRSPPLPTPPLPTGPAPKKPPRTFAHVVANDALQAAPEASKTARFKRSRTEPLIMLKRIESALKKHQNPDKSSPDAQNRVPPPRVENVRNPTFGTFQLANSPQTFATPPRTSRSSPGSTLKPSSPRGNSRQNGRNVYDLPFDDVPPRGPKLTPPTRTQEPLYSEPCLAKSKSASPPVSQPAKSLYYMVS